MLRPLIPLIGSLLLGACNADASFPALQAPGGIAFHSDWGTSTGTSEAAIRDTGKPRPWSFTQGTGIPFEVRSTATDGRDYPTANYLRVNNEFAELAFEASDDYVPMPEVGQSIYLRFYQRVTLGGGGDDTHGTYFDDHPTEGENWGPQALGIYLIPSLGNTFLFLVSAAAGQDPRYFSPGATLQKDRTYRFELRYTRTGNDAYTVGARVYDGAGSLIHDEGAFRDDYWYGGVPRLLGRLFARPGAGAASMRGLKIGLESPQLLGTGAFAEYAGLAVCLDDWCGPYEAGY